MVLLAAECMATDPVATLEACERERHEAMLERHQVIER